MYWLYCDPVLIYAAVNQMLLLKSNPLLVAEASSTIEESPINQVQRIGNGWSRVTTNTATEAALSTPSTRPLGGFDGRGQPTASPMLIAIMSGGVGISGRELLTQLINSLEQANHSFS